MPEDQSDTDGTGDESSPTELTKRQFLGATVGMGLLGRDTVSGSVQMDDQSRSPDHHGTGPGGGGHGGGPGGYGGGGDFPVRQLRVTLITRIPVSPIVGAPPLCRSSRRSRSRSDIRRGPG